MIKFSSKIYEEITVEGLTNLKAERNFKWFRGFDLKISQEDNHLLSITRTAGFSKDKYSVTHNLSPFEIIIENDSSIIIDNDCFRIKADKLYPIKNKYGEVWINDKKIGELLFEKKLVNIVLNFIPEANTEINSKLAFKVAILVLLNIVDLDGSE